MGKLYLEFCLSIVQWNTLSVPHRDKIAVDEWVIIPGMIKIYLLGVLQTRAYKDRLFFCLDWEEYWRHAEKKFRILE